MEPIKLFKNFLSLFRWNALAWQVLIFSKNQGGTTPVTDALKRPPLLTIEPPPRFHIPALLGPYKSHPDPASIHRSRFLLPFPFFLARESDLDEHPSSLPFTTVASPNLQPATAFCCRRGLKVA
jgi:hypothetical protein